MCENNLRTIVEVVQSRAVRHGEKVAYVALLDGEHETGSLTYGELHRQACAIAANLQLVAQEGDRVLLLHPPGLEYIAAYFGCLYAGMIAVPAYPPQSRNLARLLSIMNDCQAAVVMGSETLRDELQSVPFKVNGKPVEIITSQMLVSHGSELDQQHRPEVSPDAIAFLQYTSGSTAEPKGVMVSHANLIHNLEWLKRIYGHTEDAVLVSWLPVYHDMGLIGVILTSAYVGGCAVLMSPAAFVQRPARWLEAVSRYKGTLVGGPNFAYDLCLRRITPEQLQNLDLRTLNTAANGAEPLRASTVAAFQKHFAQCGLSKAAHRPCYGLAEATLIVSSSPRQEPVLKHFDKRLLEENRAVEVVESPQSRTLVSCGQTLADQKLVIVNPDTLAYAAPGEIGEIWIMGPSVAQGYWQKPEQTRETFQAHTANGDGPFLRTGDLGFLQDGELFISSRLRDLIIVNGRNHWPQDIELTAENCHPAIAPGGVAAFSIEVDGEERLAIVCEIRRSHARTLDLEAVTKNIRAAVAMHHEIEVHAAELINPSTLPKTSSGKVQRRLCRQRFLSGALEKVATQPPASRAAVAPDTQADPTQSVHPQPMKFSLFYFSSHEAEFHHDKYRLLLEGAKFADEHDFTAVWVPERHFHAFGGIFPNPSVLASALAVTTKRIRIRAGSVVLPLHHPIRVAEEWSVVDNLSSGRVDLAFARGWNPNDFVLAPGNYRNMLDVLYRDLETVRRLWRGDSIVVPNGKNVNTEVRIHPLPQQRELSTWITCSGGVERFIEAGKNGCNVLTALLFQSIEELRQKIAAYHEARLRSGHDPATGHVTLMVHTFLGMDEEQVKSKVRGPLIEYLKSSADLWRHGSKQLDELTDAERTEVLDFAFERYYRMSGLFGTPETCSERILELEKAGVNEVACLIDFGVDTKSVLKGLNALYWLQEKTKARAIARKAPVLRPPLSAAAAATKGASPESLIAALNVQRSNIHPEQSGMINGEATALEDRTLTPWIAQVMLNEIARVMQVSVESIAPNKHFLNLGINSLKAMEIMIGVQEQLSVKLAHSLLFEFPTVELAASAVARQHRIHLMAQQAGRNTAPPLPEGNAVLERAHAAKVHGAAS
jgi:natural product biosynthesis luciferase-like monooxygenase protein